MIAELDRQLPSPPRPVDLAPGARHPIQSKRLGPPDGPVTRLAQAYLAKLEQLFHQRWSGSPSNPPLGSNVDSGFFGPSSEIVAGERPRFLVSQVAADFSSWGLPKGTGVPATLVAAMTRGAVLQGGTTHFSSGRSPSGSEPALFWQAGYGGISVTQSEIGIAYVFGAAEVQPTADSST